MSEGEGRQGGLKPGDATKILIRGPDGKHLAQRALTDLQEAAARNFIANGGRWVEAATTAGYAEPKSAAFNLRNNPAVLAFIRAEQERVIVGEGRAAAVGFLLHTVRDEGAALNVRRLAADSLLREARHVLDARDGKRGDDDRPMHEWSVDELEAFIRRGREAQERAAVPTIDATAETVPDAGDIASPSAQDTG